ncbi:MAG: hypothetical protein COA99_12760 [Moraxellaceae bacterium]|nr:MAG: hypothetical protein COA99_12760 [Moraxellaceae bacterium]
MLDEEMCDEDKTKKQLIEELNIIRGNENKYRTIFNNLWDGVSVLDSEGIVVEANLAYCEMLGYEKDELIGQPVTNFIHPDNHHNLGSFQQQLESEGKASLESVDIRKDGTSIPILVRGIPCEVLGQARVIGVTQDISIRKRSENELKKSEAKYLDLYENSPTAFLSVRYTDGAIIRCNQAFCLLLGYSLEEMLNKKIAECYANTKHGVQKAKKVLDVVGQGHDIQNWQLQMQHKDGSSIWISLFVRPVLDEYGKAIETRSTVIDISAQKRLEASLIDAQKKADAANQAKSQFLSHMSHELRTPMNSILGFSQLLEKDGVNGLINSRQKECVHYILKSGSYLLALVNGVLDLSKIESGKIEVCIQDILLLGVIDECVDSMISIADKNNVVIEIQDRDIFERKVFADFIRIKQIILNILSNAIKYNKPAGRVIVKGQLISARRFRIIVEDTGLGINKSRHGELFQAFNRLGQENGAVAGTGIGLLISKKLIELMNGNIGFSSEENQGSRFWIDIPLSKPCEGYENNIVRGVAEDGIESVCFLDEPQADRTKKVLYVEDNPTDISLMKMIIEDKLPGVDLLVAPNAELGLELAERYVPDIIILDIFLPGVNGLGALKSLKSSPRTKNIKVVALTAEAYKKDIDAGLSAGFHAYLTKPINLGHFYGIINQVIDVGFSEGLD